MTHSSKAVRTAVTALAAVMFSCGAWAGPELHAFCYGTTPSCTDNNTVTPTSASAPNFGFWASSGPATGDYQIAVLVPTNYAGAPSSYTINWTIGASGPMHSASTSELATAWTSGTLQQFLGYSTSPPNPLSSWLDSTAAVDPNATGYNVFMADLGPNTLQPENNDMNGPLLSIGTLEPGTVITGFLGSPDPSTEGFDGWDAPSSGALFEQGPPPVSAPEPGALALFAAGLLGCTLFVKRRRTVRPS